MRKDITNFIKGCATCCPWQLEAPTLTDPSKHRVNICQQTGKRSVDTDHQQLSNLGKHLQDSFAPEHCDMTALGPKSYHDKNSSHDKHQGGHRSCLFAVHKHQQGQALPHLKHSPTRLSQIRTRPHLRMDGLTQLCTTSGLTETRMNQHFNKSKQNKTKTQHQSLQINKTKGDKLEY